MNMARRYEERDYEDDADNQRGRFEESRYSSQFRHGKFDRFSYQRHPEEYQRHKDFKYGYKYPPHRREERYMRA
jgi:hypothetical protein